MLLVSFVRVVCNSHRDTEPFIESWLTNPERENISEETKQRKQL